MLETVTIQKLVHGGQGLGELADGRKVFVWNALPGESVEVRIIKSKRSYAEGIAENITTPSAERELPREANYLATSPWQTMTFEAENKYKAEIVRELFQQAHVAIPEFSLVTAPGAMRNPLAGVSYGYRNKMEYSFWGDDAGLHLALHERGSSGKQIVAGSELAMPGIDAGANAIVAQLSKLGTRAGDMKTIGVRCSQNGAVVAALYTKLTKFTKLELPAELQGLRVYHSNPKSPASVATKLLYELGDSTLHDTVLGTDFIYDVDSFFQVNLPVYELTLSQIKKHCQGDPTDMYAGVGSIGLSVAKQGVRLVELDTATAAMASINLKNSGLEGEVVEIAAEKALDCISSTGPMIFDPPRAGLHPKLLDEVLRVLPPQIIYLSCNPATHARDLARLQEHYAINFFEAYNFFPRTPHIETLAVLTRKG